jgi:hypothetical protein
MLESHLTDELRRVADAVPVPDDLLPAAGLKRAVAHRRPWTMVAVAAAALLALGFSPLGQNALAAVTHWVMTYRVAVNPGAIPDPVVDVLTIQYGQTVEEKKDGVREVHRGVSVADLAGWPLPVYLGPDPEARAVLTETYREKDGTLLFTTLTLNWQVFMDGASKNLSYGMSRGWIPAGRLEEVRSGARPGVEIYGVEESQVKQQTVSIRGHEATATQVGPTWMLHWWHEGGGGHLVGNVPLEVLLKVAESMPRLE